MGKDLESVGDFLQTLILEAGAQALAHFHPNGIEHTYKKGVGEQAISHADRLANDLLVQRILKNFPLDGIISEEEDQVINPQAEYKWIFDPIDGSRNFVKGIPFWAIFGCLLHRDVPVISVVYCPTANVLYRAHRGLGALCNGSPIRCNDAHTLKGSLGAYIIGGHGVFVDEYRAAADRLLRETSWLQNLGSVASVGYVASGGMDFFMANCCSDHDYAAPALIAIESGAVVSDSEGLPWQLGRKDIIIAPPRLHSLLLQLIRECRDTAQR